jgi:Multiubiquitin
MEPVQDAQMGAHESPDHRHEHEHHHHSEEHEHHRHDVEVKVNNKHVKFTEHQVTGAVIKSTAIAQGVAIQMDFQLFRIIHGQPLKEIRDDEHVNLHECEAFRATAPDDTSSEERRDR